MIRDSISERRLLSDLQQTEDLEVVDCQQALWTSQRTTYEARLLSAGISKAVTVQTHFLVAAAVAVVAGVAVAAG